MLSSGYGDGPTRIRNTTVEMFHPQKTGTTFKMQLWDTAGMSGNEIYRQMCYPGTNVLIIAFDIANPDSYWNVRSVLIQETKETKTLKGAPVIFYSVLIRLEINHA